MNAIFEHFGNRKKIYKDKKKHLIIFYFQNQKLELILMEICCNYLTNRCNKIPQILIIKLRNVNKFNFRTKRAQN